MNADEGALAIKCSKNCAEDRMGHEHRDRCCDAVVQAHEARRLEHPSSSWSMRFAGHPGMNTRQCLPSDNADHQRMTESNGDSAIPGWASQEIHGDHVEKGE